MKNKAPLKRPAAIVNLLALLLVIACCFKAAAQELVPLYAGEIPNSRISAQGAKAVMPTLTVFLAAGEQTNNTAIIICPGGGYSWISYQNEGVNIAKALNRIGVSAFVLTYRLPNSETMTERCIGPLQDAQQAIKMVREKAPLWHLDPHKIGIAGFSAGGHLAATAATHFDKTMIDNANGTSLRPDFVVLCYPVISFADGIAHIGSRTNLLGSADPPKQLIKYFSNELQVTDQTPPTFLVHTENDAVVNVNNSIVYYQALYQHKVPSELHIYPKGAHGFGLNNPASIDQWFDRMVNWMKVNDWLKR